MGLWDIEPVYEDVARRLAKQRRLEACSEALDDGLEPLERAQCALVAGECGDAA